MPNSPISLHLNITKGKERPRYTEYEPTEASRDKGETGAALRLREKGVRMMRSRERPRPEQPQSLVERDRKWETEKDRGRLTDRETNRFRELDLEHERLPEREGVADRNRQPKGDKEREKDKKKIREWSQDREERWHREYGQQKTKQMARISSRERGLEDELEPPVSSHYIPWGGDYGYDEGKGNVRRMQGVHPVEFGEQREERRTREGKGGRRREKNSAYGKVPRTERCLIHPSREPGMAYH